MDTEVLIVGAGPTGLMLANQLARRGTRVTVIDRNAGPALETRALGVHARTLEIYQRLGVAEQAVQLGKIGTGVNLWADGKRMGRVPFGDAGRDITPFPYILVLGQDDNERILADKLLEQGVEVLRGTELVGLEQDVDRCVAELALTDGTTRRVTSRYIAGCDGAHSAVRRLCDIDFPGDAYEHVFFVADMSMTGPMISEEVNVYLWRSGFHLFFPMRGRDHWRIVGIVPEELRARGDLQFIDVQASLLDDAGDTMRFDACSWFSTYRIHHRRAAQFRHGRCFLLGDAAHIHSPVGAQGMNTGLQDATNLAWKLSLVVSGDAAPGLLASYEAERVPVAERLLATTDRAFRLVVSDSRVAGLLRTQVVAQIASRMMRRPRIQRIAFRAVSQTAIHYRSSELSRSADPMPGSAPRAGDRFPWLKLRLRSDDSVDDLYESLDDRHFHLLVFGQALPIDMPTLAGTKLVVHVVPGGEHNDDALSRAGIPPVSHYLIRPDGYIGLCGTRLGGATVDDYLRDSGLQLS